MDPDFFSCRNLHAWIILVHPASSELQGVDTFLLLVQGVRMTEATLHGGAQDQRL